MGGEERTLERREPAASLPSPVKGVPGADGLDTPELSGGGRPEVWPTPLSGAGLRGLLLCAGATVQGLSERPALSLGLAGRPAG